MRFYVELWDKKEDVEILGNLDGQSIHSDLKTVRGVLNRLKNAKPMPRYINRGYEYRIVRNNEVVYRVDVCDIIQK